MRSECLKLISSETDEEELDRIFGKVDKPKSEFNDAFDKWWKVKEQDPLMNYKESIKYFCTEAYFAGGIQIMKELKCKSL